MQETASFFVDKAITSLDAIAAEQIKYSLDKIEQSRRMMIISTVTNDWRRLHLFHERRLHCRTWCAPK